MAVRATPRAYPRRRRRGPAARPAGGAQRDGLGAAGGAARRARGAGGRRGGARARLLDHERARAVRGRGRRARSSTTPAASRGWRRFAALYAAVEAFPAPTVAVCVGNVVGAGAELAAGLRPARRRRQPQARVAGRAPRRAGRSGAPGAARRRLAREGADLHRPRRRDGGGRRRSACCTAPRPRRRPRRRRSSWPARSPQHPPEGLRRLKRMFRELEDGARASAYENELLVDFQRSGAGLPRR